jgi:hypothetical protein
MPRTTRLDDAACEKLDRRFTGGLNGAGGIGLVD